MTSSSLYKTIGTSSFIYSIGIVASRLASFALLPIYTRYLSPRDYGIMELLDITLTIFAMLLAGRFADSLFYHYSSAPSPESRAGTVGTAVLGSWFIGAIGGTVGIAVSGVTSLLVFQNSLYAHFFRIAFVSFALSLPVELGVSWLRAIDRPFLYVIASLARLGLAICFSILFVVVYRMEVLGVLWSNLATSLVMAIGLTAACLRSTGIRFDRQVFINLLKFTAPLGIGGLALFFIHSGDRFFLQRNVTLAEVGIYAMAYKLGMLLSQVQAAFGNYWTAHAYSILRGEESPRLYARINTYMMLVMVWSALAIVLFSRPVMTLMVTRQFLGCLDYVPWIAVAYVLRAEADYFRMSLYLDGKTVTDAVLNWLAAIFCIIAYATLIPVYKLWGAVAATVATFALLTILAREQSYRQRPYALERRRLVHLCVIATALSCLILIQPRSAWLQWSIATIALGAYPLLLHFTGFWRPGEVKAIEGVLAKVRAWLRSTRAEKSTAQ